MAVALYNRVGGSLFDGGRWLRNCWTWLGKMRGLLPVCIRSREVFSGGRNPFAVSVFLKLETVIAANNNRLRFRLTLNGCRLRGSDSFNLAIFKNTWCWLYCTTYVSLGRHVRQSLVDLYKIKQSLVRSPRTWSAVVTLVSLLREDSRDPFQGTRPAPPHNSLNNRQFEVDIISRSRSEECPRHLPKCQKIKLDIWCLSLHPSGIRRNRKKHYLKFFNTEINWHFTTDQLHLYVLL